MYDASLASIRRRVKGLRSLWTECVETMDLEQVNDFERRPGAGRRRPGSASTATARSAPSTRRWTEKAYVARVVGDGPILLVGLGGMRS